MKGWDKLKSFWAPKPSLPEEAPLVELVPLSLDSRAREAELQSLTLGAELRARKDLDRDLVESYLRLDMALKYTESWADRTILIAQWFWGNDPNAFVPVVRQSDYNVRALPEPTYRTPTGSRTTYEAETVGVQMFAKSQSGKPRRNGLPSEYVFTANPQEDTATTKYIDTSDGHKILPPRGALYVPPRPRLSDTDKLLVKAYDEGSIKKNSFTKKFKAKIKLLKESKNIRRVYWDDDGNMHDVPRKSS
jgi:hypothetical protein